MKKILCIVLVLALSLAFISCADKKKSSDQSGNADGGETSDLIKTIEGDIGFKPIDGTDEPETSDTTAAATEPVTEPVETEPVTEPVETEPVETAPPEIESADTAAQTPSYVAPAGDVSGYAADPYIKRITFLGDSTTYGLLAYDILPGSQGWTPPNGTLALFRAATDYIYDRTTGTEHTIGEMCSLYHPDILVVTLGVNGISFLDEETFKSYYIGLIDIIKSASPSTHIAIQTMYPLAASYDTSNGINNTKIASGNIWIADIAATCGVALINSAPVLTGSDGYRPEEWSNDGLHLSAAGFSVVLDYIKNNPCY